MEGADFDEAGFFRAIADGGVPVLTADYDFWIHIDDTAALNAAVEPFGLIPTRTPEEARATGRYVLENDEHVDVLVARVIPTVDKTRVAFDDVWERRRQIEVTLGVRFSLPCLDDLILTKRFSARPHDLDDLRYLAALREEGPAE